MSGVLLTNKEAALRLKISEQGLRVRRLRGVSPPFLRFTPLGKVYYDSLELETWISSRPRYCGTQDERRAVHAAALAAKPKATRKRRASGKHPVGDARSPRHPVRGAARATDPRRSRSK